MGLNIFRIAGASLLTIQPHPPLRYHPLRGFWKQTTADSSHSGFLASGEYLDLVAQDGPAQCMPIPSMTPNFNPVWRRRLGFLWSLTSYRAVPVFHSNHKPCTSLST
jgi:hypothetical protein